MSLKTHYTQKELDALMSRIPNRHGWNFSYMKTETQVAPWDYHEIVKKYLVPNDVVLDIGTGGGERFSALSTHFKSGIGTDIDANMIRIAQKKQPKNIQYICDDELLTRVHESFTVILNRHAPYNLQAIANKLQKGGYFITQQVGERNMGNILDALGAPLQQPVISAQMFVNTDLKVVAFMEYDIEYRVLDIESLLFWLNALDLLHANFDSSIAVADVKLLNKVLATCASGHTFLTNEHRYLVIAQKV